ncbi:hypothetical protein EMPS_09399 [Entomortierella parvispora]|uniref:Uncharacterized protein n=1 Tax=Entomortierella parvispora TaxID=205924 RepID=A0A9P3HHZ3_9FUNG|nr:hypothetical protein EMPS_09399 [Entomortierella parvispora]
MADSPTSDNQSSSSRTSGNHLVDSLALPHGLSAVSHRRTPSNSSKQSATAEGSGSDNAADAPLVGTSSAVAAPDQANPSSAPRAVPGDPSQPVVHGAGVTTSSSTTPSSAGVSSGARHKSTSRPHHPQTLLTKALLTYLKFFRVVQPLVSLGALATITPVLSYFRTQTIFPTIQATLYLFTATLACCSLFFSCLYLVDVLYHKPLFWPFTNRHFRPTSKARIGGDLIICMVFCGCWFLALIGLVIDSIWVDCGKLGGFAAVFRENGQTIHKMQTACRLEKATLGLASFCWACWMGVLLVLLYGHFWKRRQVIARRLRETLSRRQPSTTGGANSHSDGGATGTSSAVAHDGTGSNAGSILGRNNNNSGVGVSSSGKTHRFDPSSATSARTDDCGCDDTDGEVGLTGVVCNYDDDQSTLDPGSRRGRPKPSSSVNQTVGASSST